ncbi:MAG: DNA-processing protein DprA [Eubacteriales bacterium]|nr:DNA-processing protein DprA [Eubacteriales bacterium]
MEEYDWMWLCCIPGFAERDRKRLLKLYGSPENIRRAAKSSMEESGLTQAKIRRIKEHQKNFDAAGEYHKFEKQGIKFISSIHREYPEALRQIWDYPSGLFYIGRIPEKTEMCIALVGARMCSGYGRQTADKLASCLAERGVSVVSGMAFGIDAAAQSACVRAGGKSYGILGCGVDVCYPRENYELYEKLKEHGGIISEYPPGTQPLPYHFPMRNRIISGLSKTVVVVEARKKSGTLITADMALEQGRDVYAVPGRMDDPLSEGCNRLIRQGAGILNDFEDFLEESGCPPKDVQIRQKSKLVLATPENLVYSCLDSQSKSLQQIAGECKLPVQQTMQALCSLQIRGMIEENAKNYYAKTR